MGGTHVFDAPLSKINAHIRGGVIIPTQDHDVTTTRRWVITCYIFLIAMSGYITLPMFKPTFRTYKSKY